MFVQHRSHLNPDADSPVTGYEAERLIWSKRIAEARRVARAERRARRRDAIRRLVRLPIRSRWIAPKFPLATRPRRR
ncbi:hypothetical protein ILP92_05900 [Maribius pontilimi]|uniref:Uncharacterized protein n=1 Tax=Palleronia pontilimi TaxID=1964209 RepID=A0A934ID58_9RHOB|nr:hypothetical protein [Palleronia pontilimi]MBJ3762277.1 hypothetical protein [Palleronia pontilimi]